MSCLSLRSLLADFQFFWLPWDPRPSRQVSAWVALPPLEVPWSPCARVRLGSGAFGWEFGGRGGSAVWGSGVPCRAPHGAWGGLRTLPGAWGGPSRALGRARVHARARARVPSAPVLEPQLGWSVAAAPSAAAVLAALPACGHGVVASGVGQQREGGDKRELQDIFFVGVRVVEGREDRRHGMKGLGVIGWKGRRDGMARARCSRGPREEQRPRTSRIEALWPSGAPLATAGRSSKNLCIPRPLFFDATH
eukprot:9496559-Pyramimonas_sp.AAC.1